MFIVLLILTISTKVFVGARVRNSAGEALTPFLMDHQALDHDPFLMVPEAVATGNFQRWSSASWLHRNSCPPAAGQISPGAMEFMECPKKAEFKDTNRNWQKQRNFNEMTLNSDAPQNLLTVRDSKEWFDVVRPLDNYGNDISDGFQSKNWGSNCRVDFFLRFVFCQLNAPNFNHTKNIKKHWSITPWVGAKDTEPTPMACWKIPHRQFHGVPVKKSPWLVRGIYRPCLSRFFRWWLWLCPCDPQKNHHKTLYVSPWIRFDCPKGLSNLDQKARHETAGASWESGACPKIHGESCLGMIYMVDFHEVSFHICSLSLDFPYLICLIISVSYRYFL